MENDIKIDPSECADIIYALISRADMFDRLAERDHSSQIPKHKTEAISSANKINYSRLNTAERLRKIANKLKVQLENYSKLPG